MIKTPWKRYSKDGRQYRIRGEFGLEAIGDQAPYFSVTGETQLQAMGNNRWMDDTMGAIGEEVGRRFPELAPYIPWHLTSVQGPMHYLANGKYWWEKVLGISQWEAGPGEPEPAGAFARTIVLGALPDDEMPPLDTPLEEVTTWLQERFPRLRRSFINDMRELRERYGPDFGDIRHVTGAKDWTPGFGPL